MTRTLILWLALAGITTMALGQDVTVPTSQKLQQLETEARGAIEELQSQVDELVERVEAIESSDHDEPDNPVDPDPVDEPAVIETHHDTIPNFAADSTHVVSSDMVISTLSLTPDSIVNVQPGATLTIDADATVKAIGVHGTLRFDPATDVTLTVQEILVYDDGYLEIGTESQPVTGRSEIVFGDRALDLETDPSQFGNGLLVFGKATIHGRPLNQTFVRLDANPMAGDPLPAMPNDWKNGDRVVIPDTRQIPYDNRGGHQNWRGVRFTSQAEKITVGSGDTFQHDHAGPKTPHVANLTRNVVFRSENPERMRRGHTIYFDRADIDIRYAKFDQMGRTSATIHPNVDETTFNDDGSVGEMAKNHIARYAAHYHHVRGPENPDNTGYQGRIEGCVFEGFGRWGLAIHGTHYTLARQNVFYAGAGNNLDTSDAFAGAAIATEDGNESYNVIEENFICHTKAGNQDKLLGGFGLNRGGFGRAKSHTRDGMWLAGLTNINRNNVVTNCPDFGVNYNGHRSKSSDIRTPAFRGADMMDDEQVVVIENPAVIESSGNEVYGVTGNGFFSARVGSRNRSVFSDWSIWHVTRAGVYDWGVTEGFTFERFEMINDSAISAKSTVSNQRETQAGMQFGDTYYSNEGLIVRDCTIRGFNTGVRLPFRGEGKPMVLESLTLENYINAEYRTPRFEDDLQIELKNISLRSVDTSVQDDQLPESCNIWCHVDQRDPHTFLLNDTQLALNGRRIYFREQAADFVIPPYRPSGGATAIDPGAPGVGMTNAEAKAELDICIGGEIAPDTAVDGAPEILGLVEQE